MVKNAQMIVLMRGLRSHLPAAGVNGHGWIPNVSDLVPSASPGTMICRSRWFTDEIEMLGVPLGSDEKAAAYVQRKLLGKLTTMVNRLQRLLSPSHIF